MLARKVQRVRSSAYDSHTACMSRCSATQRMHRTPSAQLLFRAPSTDATRMAGAVPIAPAPLRASSPSPPAPPPPRPRPAQPPAPSPSRAHSHQTSAPPPPPPPRSPTSPREPPPSSDDVSPWLAAYTPIRVPASASAAMRDMTFTYLYEQKVYRQKTGPLHALPSLRCLARACNPKVVQEGTKRDLVCRLMLRMSENVAAQRATWDGAFEPHRSQYFTIVRHELGLRPMFYAPSHRQLLAGIPPGKERARQDRGSDRARRTPSQNSDQAQQPDQQSVSDAPATPAKQERVSARLPVPPPPAAQSAPPPPPPPPPSTNTKPPSTSNASPPVAAPPQRTEPALTNSEFARLVVLLTTRTLRSAPRQPLHFWNARVEREFNSGRTVAELDISLTAVDGSIDAARAPLCHRAGATLRNCYFETCELFAAAFRLWSASRTPRSTFHSFVNAASGTSSLSEVGKRCCIMFAALRCGFPDMMTDLTSFVWERAPAQTIAPPRPSAPEPTFALLPQSPTAAPTPVTSAPEPRAGKRRRVETAATPMAAVAAAPAAQPPASPTPRRGNALNEERVHGIVASIATSTVSAAVAASFERVRRREGTSSSPPTANGRSAATSDDRTALEKMPRATREIVKQLVTSIAAATVSAGVAATMSLSVPREDDASALICKLKSMLDLKANIASDPPYLARYVESEIVRLRTLIEASQSQAALQ